MIDERVQRLGVPPGNAAGGRATDQQRDNLCGPFHGARALLAAGVAEWERAPLDQDLVALHAGTTLPAQPVGPQVPAGAASLLDYRYELPLVDPAEAGTTPGGLTRAISSLSAERLECVPLRGNWTEDVVERLLDAAPRLGARLIANIRTGRLWGSHPPIEAVLAQLAGRDPGEVPTAEWDVGHFVELVQLVRGSGGALVLVRDSYPSLGWNAHHVQPPHAVAAALLRGDGRQGGVLAVVPAGRAAAGAAGGAAGGALGVRELAAKLPLEVELWDN